MDRERKWLLAESILIFIVGVLIAVYLASLLNLVFSNQISRESLFGLTYIQSIKNIFEDTRTGQLFLIMSALILLVAASMPFTMAREIKSELIKITPDIKIPTPAGQNQHGSAWFADKDKYDESFAFHDLKNKNYIIAKLIRDGKADGKDIEDGVIPNYEEIQPYPIVQLYDRAGVVIGKADLGNAEKIYSIDHDSHLLCLGATRSGKTRTVVLPTICMLALSGESMVITDVKGELADYTIPFLRRLGYQTHVLDFKNPKKSVHFNFLQSVIDAVDERDLPLATERTWDVVEMLGERNDRTEPIWKNGEAAVIATAVMIVVFDNQDYPEFQNLSNVYRFMSEMCADYPGMKKPPIDQYIEELKRKNPQHPAIPLYGIAKIAPARTRGSFYTSALTTLRLFTNEYIAEMTSYSDFRVRDIGVNKTTVFIVLPDQKTTYFPLATLFVSTGYDDLIMSADRQGGRLNRRVRYLLDEFGNFTKMNNFEQMLTAGGSRGILFSLFLQDFAQIDSKYSREVSRIVKSNCETWVYLRSDDPETLKTLSEKLGKYTTRAYSQNMNNQRYSHSSGQSAQLIGRSLLEPDEIKRIDRPYSLVTSRNPPAIMTAPDLSKWQFNTILGLGDEKHNNEVRRLRGEARIERHIGEQPLWEIWRGYQIADNELEAVKEVFGDDLDIELFRRDANYRQEHLDSVFN